MLSHVPRYDWRLHFDQLRPSVLGSAPARRIGKGPPAARTNSDDEAIPSRETIGSARAAVDALLGDDESEHAHVLSAVVRDWAADNAAGGIGAFAHLPLPKDFAKTLAQYVGDSGNAERDVMFDHVIGKFDPSVRSLVARQIASHMGPALADAAGAFEWLTTPHNEGGNTDHTSETSVSHSALVRQGSADESAATAGHEALESTPPRDGFAEEIARLLDPAPDEVGAAAWIGAEEGARTAERRARPVNTEHRSLEWDPMRPRELQQSPDRGREYGEGFQRVVLPAAIGLFLRDRGVKAIKGAAYGVAADLIVTIIGNRMKRPEDRRWPTAGSLLNSAVTGAISRARDFGPEQWKEEAGLAFLGSLAEDWIDNKEPRWVGAIGAAVGAGLYTKYGKARLEALLGTKVLARLTTRAVSKMIKEVFGADVQLLPEDMKEFIEGFGRAVDRAEKAAEYWERKVEELSRMLDPLWPVGPLET